MYDIIIIGAGPAGMTAALYALRAGKTALLIEKQAFGGQITYSPKVENYPGYESISGNEFADKLLNQVTELGAEIEVGEVLSVADNGEVKAVHTAFKDYECRAVIFATGATHRSLDVVGEKEFVGKGVSYCAVCDGSFFKNKIVAVNGGGNSALQEAIYLSEICETVYLIHRRDEYRADKALSDKIMVKKNIVPILETVIEKVNGEISVHDLSLKNVKTGQKSVLQVDGLFVSIGLNPQNSAYSGLVMMNEHGYADIDDNCTANDGVFVAGDCRRKSVRQLTTAVGDGAIAAVNACHYIDSLDK